MTLFISGHSNDCGHYQAYRIKKGRQTQTHGRPQQRSSQSALFSGSAFSPKSEQSQPQSFSVFRAAKETVKGVFRPLTTMIKHPFKTAFTLGATVALAAAAPITIPIMVAAGLGFGAVQTLRGVKTAITEAARGNYEASEKAFGNIGEGGFSVVSSLLGIRQAGSIAAEAKASRLSLSVTASVKEKLTAVDNGLKAALEVKTGTWTNAFKETFSVFSSEGLKTTGSQLNPVRLAALAKGKAQSVISLFQESPVVDLDAAVQKARRFLKIKNKDMPTTKPNLVLDEVGDMAGKAHGFYHPEKHSLHIQPDRQTALRGRLSHSGKKLFDKLPDSLKTLLGNLYKRSSISIDEIATHELTHARQFNQVATLTPQQAHTLLQRKFPGVKLEQIDNVIKTLRLQGSGTTASINQGQRTLTQVAEYHFNEAALKNIGVKQLFSGEKTAFTNTQAHLFKNYTRAGFEVEARQKAAESAIVDTIGKLAKPQNLFQESQLLQKYKTLKLEARLNKLMGKINALKGPNQAALTSQYERQIKNLAGLPAPESLTRQYVRKESILERKVQIMRSLTHFNQEIKNIQTGQTSLFQTIRKTVGGWVSGIVKGIQSLFTGPGLQRFEQKHHSLKPTYVTLNHKVNQRQSSSYQASLYSPY